MLVIGELMESRFLWNATPKQCQTSVKRGKEHKSEFPSSLLHYQMHLMYFRAMHKSDNLEKSLAFSNPVEMLIDWKLDELQSWAKWKVNLNLADQFLWAPFSQLHS